MGSTGLFKRHPLWSYIVIAFVFSWALWTVLIATTPPGAMQEGISPSFIILAVLGGFGPSLAGIVATAIVDGRTGLRELFARFRRWRVPIGWYAVALLITPLVGLVTVAGDRVFGLPSATWESALATLPISIIWPIFAALGEEFGWRGFMLPRLQRRHSALWASIIVAVAWGAWHIPTQYLAFRQFGLLIVLAHFLVDNILVLIPMATAMTWVHSNTGQSLLLMLVFHFGITFTAQTMSGVNMPVADGLWHGLIYSAVYWVVAATIIAMAGPKRLVRESRSAQ
jgi:membrane protease YdiL (CAAX protease family)